MLEYLEKVFAEYLNLKDYLKVITKPVEELRKDVLKNITTETSSEEAQKIYFDKMEKVILHQRDFVNQQNRLFYTVEAYKDLIEIPKEILEEVKGLKFIQYFAIKNDKAEVVDEEAYEFTRQVIQKEFSDGIEQFKNKYLKGA